MKRTLLAVVILLFCLAPPTLAAPPARIVSLAPNITEILYDLGLEDRVAAVTDYCDYPPAVKGKPRVGGFTNPSLEAIVAARPDIVILTDDGNGKECSAPVHRPAGVGCGPDFPLTWTNRLPILVSTRNPRVLFCGRDRLTARRCGGWEKAISLERR